MSQRNHIDGQKAHEKMLNIINHQRKANQNHNEYHLTPARMKVKVAQLCLTLCNLVDYRVHGILQARILEWVAFPFSRESSQPRN